jgi:hypothetical protein
VMVPFNHFSASIAYRSFELFAAVITFYLKVNQEIRIPIAIIKYIYAGGYEPRTHQRKMKKQKDNN